MPTGCINSRWVKISYGNLALHRAGSDALDDVLLAEQVDNDDGQNGHHDDRHGRAQIHGAIATLQVLDVDGDGAVLGDVQNQMR